MNLRNVVRGMFRRVPASLRSRVTLKDPKTGQTTVGQAAGIVPMGAGDTFADRTATRSRTRRIPLLPDGLAFAPIEGMLILWGGFTWTILGVSPLNPDGGDPVLYRLVINR